MMFPICCLCSFVITVKVSYAPDPKSTSPVNPFNYSIQKAQYNKRSNCKVGLKNLTSKQSV